MSAQTSPGGQRSDVLGLPQRISACLFDMDGVLTDTASLHAAAWKLMFDDFLTRRGERPFDLQRDYEEYVDGRTREEGVRAFLQSRGIELPDGSDGDDPASETIAGLAAAKNAILLERMRREGVHVFEGSVRYLDAAIAAGMRTAVVSSSANCREALRAGGIDDRFTAWVDGNVIARERLASKPAPDAFLFAARELGADPSESAVFEDALSGVEAGRNGGFGFVVGVDRVGQERALREHGADVVVPDLERLLETGR